MPKMILEVETKRPLDATPARALALVAAGVRIPELAVMWGVSRADIYKLLHRAGWETARKKCQVDAENL